MRNVNFYEVQDRKGDVAWGGASASGMAGEADAASAAGAAHMTAARATPREGARKARGRQGRWQAPGKAVLQSKVALVQELVHRSLRFALVRLGAFELLLLLNLLSDLRQQIPRRLPVVFAALADRSHFAAVPAPASQRPPTS